MKKIIGCLMAILLIAFFVIIAYYNVEVRKALITIGLFALAPVYVYLMAYLLSSKK